MPDVSIAWPRIEFTEERLENGLRLILAEDHLVPIAAVDLWYDVGSLHEQPGQTGLAHLFEHMMFQGSTNVAKAEHFKLIEQAGGSLNGTTWLHRTTYFEFAPSHQLELMLWLEADRMGGLLDALGQETLDNQRDVVKNEKRQTYDNRPYGSFWERLLAKLFPEGHPYHHTTIGSMQDLSAVSLEDVREFFRTYYAPNNAVLAVAGDFEADRVRDWVRRYFGDIPSNPNIPARPKTELPLGLAGERRETIPDRVPLSRVYVGYRSPGVETREADALIMASYVLMGGDRGGGKAGRLHRRLVRDRRLAQDVEFYTQEFYGVSIASGWATARPGIDVAELEAAFHEALESIAEEGVSDEELERVRAAAERAEIEAHHMRLLRRADRLAECATVYGDPNRANEALPRLMDIRAEEIRDVARDVLTQDNRVVLTFVPEEGGAR